MHTNAIFILQRKNPEARDGGQDHTAWMLEPISAQHQSLVSALQAHGLAELKASSPFPTPFTPLQLHYKAAVTLSHSHPAPAHLC